jgi:hypothetical protein
MKPIVVTVTPSHGVRRGLLFDVDRTVARCSRTARRPAHDRRSCSGTHSA